MVIIYNLIFLLFALINLPVYLLKGKFHKGFSARFGKLPKDLFLDKPIWVHAVSVGEALAAAGLIEELRRSYPAKKFVISTVTPTGNKLANKCAKAGDLVTYLPFDLSWIISSVIDRIDPSLFVIAETEIWPNLIRYLHSKHIPVVIVNGRISDKSLKGYLAIKSILSPTLRRIDLFLAQTGLDAERFKAIGSPEDRVKVTGNMKFDNADSFQVESPDKTRSLLGLKPQDLLFTAASTHPGEEKIILSVYKELLAESPGLRLLIAPRHPERAHEIFGLAKKSGFDSARITKLHEGLPTNANTVFILDTIGQLLNFYNASEIVFVGGSLIKKGGHNILEPAALAKPIVFGPNMFNFRDMADLFLKNKAAIMVQDGIELKACIADLLKDAKGAREMAGRAKQLIRDNQGATLCNIK